MKGLAELAKSRPAYELADAHYQGTVPEYFANPRLARKLRGAGEKFRFNFAKIPVDAVVERLEIAAVTVPSSPTLTQVLQRKVWDANELLEEAPQLHRKVCTHGDGFAMVWDGDEEGEVDVFYQSPLTCRIVYRTSNPRKVDFVIKVWSLGNGTSEGDPGQMRADLYYADRIERWITQPKLKGDKESDWVHYVDDDEPTVTLVTEDGEVEVENWPLENPYGRVPFFHFRVGGRPYGLPEHLQAYGPQEALNKILVSHMSTIDYQIFPQRYALKEAMTTEDAEGDADDDFAEDGISSPTEKADDRSSGDMSAHPGNVWLLRGMKSVGQFDPAPPEVFLKPWESYIRAMSHLTTTPGFQINPFGQQPSGESRRRELEPLNRKARDRQMGLAGTWSELFSFALLVLGYGTLEEPVKVDVRFLPPAVLDDTEGYAVLKAKRELGVPIRQCLLEAGYTAEQCDAFGIPKLDVPNAVEPTGTNDAADDAADVTEDPAPRPTIPVS